MGSRSRHFAYAPMSALFVVLTGLVLTIPVVLVVLGLGTASPVRFTLLGSGALIVVAAVGVWLFYKPREVVLDESELRVVFPMRELALERSRVSETEILRRSDLRKALGFAVRVGVGGLFGVFGWLYSSRLGWVRIYATNTGDWLLVRTREGRPLILSPADPEGVQRELGG